MDLRTASKVTQDLVRQATNGTLRAMVKQGPDEMVVREVGGRPVKSYEPSTHVVFTGGAYGDASIDARASSPERVRAHWQGYLEANGLSERPRVGQEARFGSGSSSTGIRWGKVVKVGSRRATIAYTFKSGKRARSIAVPFHKMAFGRITFSRAHKVTDVRRSR